MWSEGHLLQAGKYQIQKKLGEGGFGLTYLAKDTRLKRQVVIKTPNQIFRTDQEYKKFVRRFQREGQALSKINHPNVVQVYEYFQEAGMPCLVMAYVEGETLNERIRNKGRLSQDTAVECFRKLGKALNTLHKNGLIHCDIHPGNIILRPNSDPIIIDFGSAKLLQPSTFTVTTTVNESFAPYEQGNKDNDPHPTLDVYALAATLYFVVTGQKPQESRSRKMFGDKLQPPKQIVGEIQDWLNQVILKGMALEAQDRPSSMEIWADLLTPEQPTEVTINQSAKPFSGSAYQSFLQKPITSSNKLKRGIWSNTLLQSGTSLKSGEYQIKKKIRTNGFKVTYLAEDSFLKRHVIIETPNRQFQSDKDYERFIKRFKREHQVLSQINHPNVVQVIEYFKEAGMPCLVTTYVEGETLNERIRSKGRLSQNVAVGHFRKLAEALHTSHKRGLIHCDVHPGNIILQPDGEPMLINFGSAKLLQPGTFTVTTTVNESFAPYEQGNKESDPHPTLDIYALAATLYFSVTGKKPQASISRKMFGDRLQPPKQLCEEIKDRLNHCILKGMALEANNRPISMQDWMSLLYPPQPTVINPSSKTTSRIIFSPWWAIAIVAASSAAGGLSLFLSRKFQTYSSINSLILPKPITINLDITPLATTPASPHSEQAAHGTADTTPNFTEVELPAPNTGQTVTGRPAPNTETIVTGGSNFYVVTSYTGDASLNKARELVPDAFVRNFKAGARIQLAAFDNRAEAEDQIAFLTQQGAAVEIFGPTNE